ncbi:MAG: cyanophycin synthetase family protein [Coriobacteriia bacterium]
MRVHAVTVCSDRVDVVVGIDEAGVMRTATAPGIADRALELLPDLERHLCHNGTGRSFAEEIADTEVPHLFEHVVMELMAQAGSPRSLKGETSWDFRRDGKGVFRVSVEYDDDFVCLGAIKLADTVMGYLLDDGTAPDVVAATGHLRELRARPRAS